MVRSFHLRCRTRRRLIWLVTLLLLWQQVALAAYVCPQPAPPAAVAAGVAMTRADGMSRMPMGHRDLACVEHCAAAPSAQPDVRAPNVPASLLSVLPPLAMAVDRLPGHAVPVAPGGHVVADSPPSRLRYCTLLI